MKGRIIFILTIVFPLCLGTSALHAAMEDDIGHAVVGDQKYGSGDRDHQPLALHARSISFKHPFMGQQLTFESQVPVYFNQLVGKV